MEEMHQIAAKLMERTAEDKIPWKATVSPDSIGAKVGDFSVVITSQSVGYAPNRRLVFHLVALDEEGEEMGSIRGDGSDRKHHSDLKRLFESAKKSAHKAKYGGKLDQLLATLENSL